MTAMQPVPRYLHCVYRNHLQKCSHPDSKFSTCICTSPTGICWLPLPTAFSPQTTPDYLLCNWRDIYNHCNAPGSGTKLSCTQPSVCLPSEHADCPFCAFRRLTPWYLCDTVNNIVVCEDLQPKQYSFRILVVGFGTDWHVPYAKLSLPKKDLLLELLKAIIAHHLVTSLHIGKPLDAVKIDFDHSYPAHGHLQACMQAKEVNP